MDYTTELWVRATDASTFVSTAQVIYENLVHLPISSHLTETHKASLDEQATFIKLE